MRNVGLGGGWWGPDWLRASQQAASMTGAGLREGQQVPPRKCAQTQRASWNENLWVVELEVFGGQEDFRTWDREEVKKGGRPEVTRSLPSALSYLIAFPLSNGMRERTPALGMTKTLDLITHSTNHGHNHFSLFC